jgi:hypothetical protein
VVATTPELANKQSLQTLPNDAVRQIMWRFADRFDFQMLVQSTREVARGPVARLVAQGGRRYHRGPEEPGAGAGGLRAGLGGRRRGDLQPGGNLAYAPIHERGTRSSAPTTWPGPARSRARTASVARRLRAHRAHPLRGRRHRRAGRQGARRRVEGGRGAGAAGGQARPLHHQHGLRQLRHRRRGFGDPRIKGSCMVILEEATRALFDRGAPTKKLVHQLSSTATRSSACRPGQPHHRRLHDQGRGDRAQLQPRRGDRGRVPPHARDGGLMTSAKLLGRRAGDPLPARPLPRRRGAAGLAALRLGCSRRRTRCTGWSTSGPRARPAPRSASPARAVSTNSTRSSAQGRDSSPSRASGGPRADAAMRKVRRTRLECLELARPASCDARDGAARRAGGRPIWCSSCARRAGQRALPGLQALEHRHGANMMREASA